MIKTPLHFAIPPRIACSVRAAACLIALLTALPAAARDHWVAAGPPSGAAPDGTPEAPWPDSATALAAAKDADRILLAPGNHGRVKLSGASFDRPVTITSAPGGRAHLDRLRISDAAGLVIRDLDIWPPTPETGRVRGPVVKVSRNASDIVLQGLDIRSTEGAAEYYTWDRETWRRLSTRGVHIDGADVTLADSTISGASVGMGLKGARARIIGNDIRGFSADGIRVFGAGTVLRGNTIRDCVDVSGNHDDGIQSWARRGDAPDEVIDIVIDGNRILEWTGPDDHPLRGRLQGIGLFDGPYRNWTITNNLVATQPWHGIHLGTVLESRVLNNTVVNITGSTAKKPWIKATPGTMESGTVVANNVAPAYRLFGKHSYGRANVTIRYPYRLFEDPGALDFRPKLDSPLIDAADPARAPDHDIDGTARPQAAGPDHGAFERR